ncbi:dihydroneopterin aldolase [bacterium endosymbiont of Pedicinus badii]|uniref:dihydroneopterin aldolase n=1 Tax=bacterium endosymbiont of Pedicinus badii TaxID=1719126 RepID=UPI0009B93284|nr:dihydroneopterin aldolase [bacterium endosymbiont of Pedicinus badii]OQM34160.1 hypothetical protein AOQ89_02365 [bacterium endosymbiont of Pedicinus badii]
MYTIFVKNLSFYAKVGIYDWEKNKKQRIVFDVKIDFKNFPNLKKNNMNQFVDYDFIEILIRKIIKNNHFPLLEDIVYEVIKKIKKKFSSFRISIKIRKGSNQINSKNFGIIVKKKVNF